MSRVLVLLLMVSVSQMAAAGMYMCVDEATGATTFTDKACETAGSREEIRVNPINPGSEYKARRVRPKTWRSQLEARKTGTDYNAERRSLYENKASASTN